MSDYDSVNKPHRNEDAQQHKHVGKRSPEETERERSHRPDLEQGNPEAPGGAEGESSSKHKAAGFPSKDDKTPLGDTDQHSSAERVPSQRED